MAADYYQNERMEPDKSDMPDESDNGNGKGQEDSGQQTALLPKSILAGKDFEPGEEVVLKIVRMYDDEVEVEYATEDKDNKKDSAMGKADGELAAMGAATGEGEE